MVIPPAASEASNVIAVAAPSPELISTPPAVEFIVRSAAPVTVKLEAVAPSREIPAAVSTAIAPANALPTVTPPVDVPVLIDVATSIESLIRVIASMLTVVNPSALPTETVFVPVPVEILVETVPAVTAPV